MLTVEISGHDNYYGVSDVLRLFFDRVSEDREAGLVKCENAPDMKISSSVYGDRVVTALVGTDTSVTGDELPVNREVKRTLYKLLSDITGRTYPWGCLTGIRPTLVASELSTPEQMTSMYYVRPDKAELAFKTASVENAVLEKLPEDKLNIYVGIPFCPSRCEYCSFVAQDITKHMDLLEQYLCTLIDEIKTIGAAMKDSPSSIYVGGGTPTVFSESQFDRLMEAISVYLPLSSCNEFTVEAGRADTITMPKLQVMRNAGADRVCINPQTMCDTTLQKLNRRHTSADTIRAYNQAREAGFDIVNMDLIAGLKYEEATELLNSLRAVMALDPANITIHTLYKKKLAFMSREDVMDKDLSRGSVDSALTEAYSILFGAGYEPYYMYRQKDTGHGLENTGLAKPGTECLYNVAMMSDRRSVLSFGAGGMSKRIFDMGRLERCPSVKDVITYNARMKELAEKKIQFFEL